MLMTLVSSWFSNFNFLTTFLFYYNYFIYNRWFKEFSDPYVTKTLFISLVRPILEYCAPVWIEFVHKSCLIFALTGFRPNTSVLL